MVVAVARAGWPACLLITLLCIRPADAAVQDLVARLHGAPPAPCIAKPPDDRSSLIAIAPDGITRGEVIGHMAALGGMFLATGAERMTPMQIDTVYTAVFYQDAPANEVGVYGYRFRQPIDAAMFSRQPGLNGRLFVVGERLLVLLWHEGLDRAGRCYAAMAARIEAEAG